MEKLSKSFSSKITISLDASKKVSAKRDAQGKLIFSKWAHVSLFIDEVRYGWLERGYRARFLRCFPVDLCVHVHER